MANNPEEHSNPSVDDDVQKYISLKQGGSFSNGAIASLDEGER